jgi:hypothetical protein
MLRLSQSLEFLLGSEEGLTGEYVVVTPPEHSEPGLTELKPMKAGPLMAEKLKKLHRCP